jgi:ankyrin repeat protein
MRFTMILAAMLPLGSHWAAAASANQVTAAEARAAVDKYIPLLESTLQKFSCAGACHHSLGLMVYGMARERSVPVHEEVFADAIHAIHQRSIRLLEPFLQGIGEPEPGMQGYWAVITHASGHPDPSGPFLAWWIAARQTRDGSWRMITHRPPMQDSHFTATALSLRMLQLEMPSSQAAETAVRIGRARNWLMINLPQSTEDEAFRLLGLHWSGASNGEVQNAVRRLTSEQHPDGGWSQLPDRASDAYATGLVLYALREGAEVPLADHAYQLGLSFLLKTQLPDGSWLVPTRHHPPNPGLPYVETGFPHRESQFISCAGSNWAAMALLSVLPRIRDIEPVRPERPNLPAWVETALFGSAANMQTLLDAGLDPNAATQEGTSVLMFSVNDARKVRLLLERGADVNHQAQSGATALFVVANLRGTMDAFRLLLNAGADVNITAANGGTVLGVAITSEAEKVVLLLAKGADPNRRLVHGGVAPLYPLQLAVTAGDGEVVDLLVSHGAEINRQDPAGFELTPLSIAVKNDNLAMVKLLISLGADLNQRDSLGMTPLLWSAIWDYGRDDVAQALLDAGVDPSVRDPNHMTALELAEKFRSTPVERLLMQSRRTAGR